MLNAGVRVSMAMYAAIRNSKIQMDVLEAAARLSLSTEDLELFGAILILVKRAGAKRHKLAHGLWGYSDDLPNALLLYDPDEVLIYSAATTEFIRAVLKGEGDSSSFTTMDKSRIFVYREKELAEILAEMKTIDHLTKSLLLLLPRTQTELMSYGPSYHASL